MTVAELRLRLAEFKDDALVLVSQNMTKEPIFTLGTTAVLWWKNSEHEMLMFTLIEEGVEEEVAMRGYETYYVSNEGGAEEED